MSAFLRAFGVASAILAPSATGLAATPETHLQCEIRSTQADSPRTAATLAQAATRSPWGPRIGGSAEQLERGKTNAEGARIKPNKLGSKEQLDKGKTDAEGARIKPNKLGSEEQLKRGLEAGGNKKKPAEKSKKQPAKKSRSEKDSKSKPGESPKESEKATLR